MKFSLNNLKAYIIICLSVGYATFTSSIFLAELLQHHLTAIIGALALAVIAHLYLIEGVKELKNNKFNASFLIAILLCGSVVYFDLHGVWEKSAQERVDPVVVLHEKEKHTLEEMINVQDTLLAKSSKHTVNGKTNWALYNTYNKSYKLREQLIKEREALAVSHQASMELALGEQEQQASQMIGLSLILFVLSTLVSFTLKEEDVTQEIPKEKQVLTKQIIGENFPKLNTVVRTVKNDTAYPHLDNKTEAQRIKMCAEYIKKYNQTDSRKLCSMFRLNFSMLKKAKELIGNELEITDKPKHKQLGFRFVSL